MTDHPSTLVSPPPHYGQHILLSYPRRHILLLKFNRPDVLNALSKPVMNDLNMVLNWFEKEPDLWVLILTGVGSTFCVGADLKWWRQDKATASSDDISNILDGPGGFGSLSRRRSSKPIIAAVNGHALGGGSEIVVNSDIVVASMKAKFGFPEVHVGVVAASGGIQRLLRIAGHQRASEVLLTGRDISAVEARDVFRFVNDVVPSDRVLPRALEYAEAILDQSPDSIRSTKKALNEAALHGNIDDAWKSHVISSESRSVYFGENIKEGLDAFNDRRKPKWISPKL